MVKNLPTYNLKAVIHETGLTPATLRAWERRYGLLKPQRSPGGHRLYTQDEIEMLKWLVARQSEGLSISHAIDLWRNQDQASLTVPRAGVAKKPDALPGTGTLDQLRDNWLSACLAFDESTAELALSKALAIATPEVVCSEVLQKGLAELGEGWYKGIVSVQQEHFASALAVRRLNALFAVAPNPTRSGRVLAACPPGEEHDLALLMVAFILRWQGWDVVYLGANVPLTRLDTTLQATNPGLLLSVAQTLPGAAALTELADYVNRRGVALAYGGGIFNKIPALTGRIPGHFLGYDMHAVPQVVERLLSRRPEVPIPQPLSVGYAIALESFQEKEAHIIASVNQLLRDSAIVPQHLDEANANLTRAIASALLLGDIHFLDHSVGWLIGFLENYGISNALAGRYYAAYHQSVQEHLGSQAQPVLDWLAQVIKTV